MIPTNITKKHILQALEDIDSNGLRYALGESSVYDLVYQGKKYPPKHVIIVANEFANDSLLAHTELTTQIAQRFLTKLGPEFKIEQKKKSPVGHLLENYKEELIQNGLSDEIYKWSLLTKFGGMPNIKEADFKQEMEKVRYENLVFYNNERVRKHILINHSEAYREALTILFDEQLDLAQRIPDFQASILKTYRSMGEQMGHHHDERSIATILTFKYPGKYTFYKSSFYRKYCQLIGEKPKKKNQKYVHYLELIDKLIKDYISIDSELLALVKKNLPEDLYQDESHKLLAQDILFKMLDKKSLTFTAIIDNLREVIAEEESTVKDFTVLNENFMDNGLDNPKDSYVWIADAQHKIGNLQAHYEVSVRSRGSYKNCIFTDIHFEDKDKKQFHQILGDALPEPLQWISWHSGKSIGTKIGLDPKDSDIVEKIIEQLSFLETSVADPIRKILSGETSTNQAQQKPMPKQPLNQILYGPPGTGKTFHTIDKALKIIAPEFYQANHANRNALTEQFKTLLIRDFDQDEGQIAFCTFHQSMAYEDFIEGIKPVAPKGTEDSVNYRVADGIFKKLCTLAAKTKSISGFDVAYEKFINDIIENNNTLVLHTPKRNKPFNIRINSNHNVVSIPQTANATEMVVTKKMVMHYIMDNVVDDWGSYTIAISEYLKTNFPFTIDEQDNSKKNYILIIDEINRGNVSQIFGELITLIEENKRSGEKEALEITLPYSAQPFSVPKNLYLIGTMNTADRSVEALDSALRRRFSFEQMPSNPALLSPQRLIWQLWWSYENKPWNDPEFIKKEQQLYKLLDAKELAEMNEEQKESIWQKMTSGASESVFAFPFFQAFNFQNFLEKINARLEKLLSPDHAIGHAYLMNVFSMEALQEVIYTKIIPLLQEYFYGDLGKIGLVLGQGFIEAKPATSEKLFAEFDYDTDSLNEKEIYHILDYRESKQIEITIEQKKLNCTFPHAIELLLGKKINIDA